MDSICLKYDVVFGARKPCPHRAGARFLGGLAVFLEKNIYITLKFHDIIEYEFHIVQNFLSVTIDLYLDKVCF